MRRVLTNVAFRINFTRASWTTWLGLVLTLVAITITASLSVSAFQTAAASTANATSIILELAPPNQIDQLARAKYQDDQAAKRAAAAAAAAEKAAAQLAAQARPATQQTTTTRPTAKPTATPTCDRLIIPRIGLNACLATVGLAADGTVDVHASLPAWFNQSSRAGTSSGRYSATFIDGHRSGIFKNLGRLAVGDTVMVTFVGGESYTYTVRATEIAPLAQVDMAKALSIYGGAGQGLNLMTCDGAYNTNLGTAERRLTVYATW
ncbi:class F sortase [Candidatus Saccharibacteria bacterium]|nr:class F sortase [Candidatus Saccharibacteria bacterium]